MAGTIAAKPMITMTGSPRLLEERLRNITRPGVDGSAFKKLGKRADWFEVRTMSGAASAAAAKTLIQGYRDLVGTLVVLVDDHDITWNNVVVLRIAQARITKIRTPAGGTAGMTHAVFVTWELQLTQDA